MPDPTPRQVAVPTWPAADLYETLLAGLDLAEAVVSCVGDDQRAAPTPCPGLDVEHLVAHLIAGVRWFADLPTTVDQQTPAPAPADPDLAGVPLGRAFADAARVVRRGWTVDDVTRRYLLPWGAAPGAELVGFMTVELIGHAWDLATATGQPRYPVDDLAEVALVLAHELDQQTLRSPGMMGPQVHLDPMAGALERFVAFLGRDPVWRP